MDSGSGSLQSSSGGDEDYEYDYNSHHHQQQQAHDLVTQSSFLNNVLPSHIISSGSQIPQHPPFHFSHNYQNHHLLLQPTFYDFSSNHNRHHPPYHSNSLVNNFDIATAPATSLRSEPNQTDFKTLLPGSSQSHPQACVSNHTTQAQFRDNGNNNPRGSSFGSSSSSGLNPKTTKKRTRASRRAPTTVLTTDTSNFRAMVQEFTGIPAPPFSASTIGSPYNRRFDLFGGSSSISGLRTTVTTTTATHLDRPGLRVQHFSSSSPKPPLLNNNNNMNYNNNNNAMIECQTFSNIQNQAAVFSFQSLSDSGNDFHSKQLRERAGSNQLMTSSGLQNDESWRNSGGAAAAAGRPNNENNIINCYDIMA